RGLRILIREGVPAARAIRLATRNGATRYGLHDLGAVAPGKLADLVLLESLEDVRATTVLSGGRVVVRDGKLVVDIPDPVPAPVGDSVRIGPISTEDFTLKHADGDVRLRVMELDRNRTTRLGAATVTFQGGR